MSLFHLVYVSSATDKFSDSDLIKLLERSRVNNAMYSITGMLLYRDGNFMQMLEGDEQTVRETHTRILRDSRHHGAITLLQGKIAKREFADWTMGFRNLDSQKMQDVAGYNDFLNLDWFGTELLEDPNRAIQLLFTFRSGFR